MKAISCHFAHKCGTQQSPEDQGTRGQRTKRPQYQRTAGPEDHGTGGPQDRSSSRKKHPIQEQKPREKIQCLCWILDTWGSHVQRFCRNAIQQQRHQANRQRLSKLLILRPIRLELSTAAAAPLSPSMVGVGMASVGKLVVVCQTLPAKWPHMLQVRNVEPNKPQNRCLTFGSVRD